MAWYDTFFGTKATNPEGATPGVSRPVSAGDIANAKAKADVFTTLIGSLSAPQTNGTPGGGGKATTSIFDSLAQLGSVIPHLDLGANSSSEANPGQINLSGTGSAGGLPGWIWIVLGGCAAVYVWKEVR